MAGTKGKKQKGTFIERTVRRLEKIHAYGNLHAKVNRWKNDETTESLKPALVELANALLAAETAHDHVVDLFSIAAAANYVPPKKQFVGVIKLDPGKQVWIKPQHVAPYAKIYNEDMLNNLFVSSVVEGKVIVSIGLASDEINEEIGQVEKVQTFIVPKAILMANAPDMTEESIDEIEDDESTQEVEQTA